MTVLQPGDIGFERPRFFDGERLTADDLFAAQTYERELRWLHNRTLHPWGIARGLTVSGGRGDRSVTIGAGYALDCLGRDIIVPDDTVLQVPPVAGDSFWLTVSYLDDADLPPQQRTGVCDTSGAVRLPERGRVRFQPTETTVIAARYLRGRDVVLAKVTVKNCALDAAPDTAARDDAAVDSPYIGAGQTDPGATTWTPWPASGTPVGVSTTVPTASAAFAVVPAYQASVIGDRVFSGQGGQKVVDGPAVVAAPALTSFDVRVDLSSYGVLNPAEVRDPSFAQRLTEELEWYVSWIGVEV